MWQEDQDGQGVSSTMLHGKQESESSEKSAFISFLSCGLAVKHSLEKQTFK